MKNKELTFKDGAYMAVMVAKLYEAGAGYARPQMSGDILVGFNDMRFDKWIERRISHKEYSNIRYTSLMEFAYKTVQSLRDEYEKL